jgi:hypothetical protein
MGSALLFAAMKTYHYTLGFPKESPRPKGHTKLKYSLHAIEQANRKNIQSLPVFLTWSFQLIELTLDHGVLIKSVVRVPHTETEDLVLVVSANGTVITLWHNSRSDNHRTLNTSKYAKP